MSTQKTPAELVHAMFYTLYNFNANQVLEKAFPQETEFYMHKHLKSKLEGYCSKEGYASANAILKFAGDLDSGNIRKFCQALAEIAEAKEL